VSETPNVSHLDDRKRRRWRLPQAGRGQPEPASPDARSTRVLQALRWTALAAYGAFLIHDWYQHGLPFARDRLLLTIVIGLGCLSIGRPPRQAAWAIVDFLPFALVLLAYDALRGLADGAGMPTWWSPQVRVDTFLFAGHEPTVWLQEHLKHAPDAVR
jgi:hypothetical protein